MHIIKSHEEYLPSLVSKLDDGEQLICGERPHHASSVAGSRWLVAFLDACMIATMHSPWGMATWSAAATWSGGVPRQLPGPPFPKDFFPHILYS